MFFEMRHIRTRNFTVLKGNFEYSSMKKNQTFNFERQSLALFDSWQCAYKFANEIIYFGDLSFRQKYLIYYII